MTAREPDTRIQEYDIEEKGGKKAKLLNLKGQDMAQREKWKRIKTEAKSSRSPYNFPFYLKNVS